MIKVFFLFLLFSLSNVMAETCIDKDKEKALKNKNLIVGEGQARFKDEARDAALVNIAKFFKTRVKRTSFRDSFKEANGKSGIDKFNQLINETDFELYGAKITSECYDDDIEQYFALATINKVNYYQILKSSIAPHSKAYDRFIQDYLKYRNTKQFDLSLIVLRKALSEKAKADSFLFQLQVMDFNTNIFFKNSSRYYGILQSDSVKIKYCLGTIPVRMKDFVMGVLDKKGISYIKGNNCKRKIKFYMDTSWGNNFGSSIMVKGKVRIQLISKNGQVADSFNYEASGLGRTKNQALDSFKRNLDYTLKNK